MKLIIPKQKKQKQKQNPKQEKRHSENYPNT